MNVDKPESKFEKVGEFAAIYQRGEMWYVNYQHEGRQVRRSLKVKTKKEARRRALLIEKEILSGEHKHQRRSPKIAELVEQYIEHLAAEGRAKKTLSKYRVCFDMLLKICERRNVARISQLSVVIIDQYRAERAAGSNERKAAAPKTVHNDTVTIRQLVNYALRLRLINDDPLRGLRIKKPKRTPQPCWTAEEREHILAEAESPHREPLIFLADTGCRAGEAKWLTPDDVDIERRLIHIRPKAGWKPKSGDQRVIPMTDRLYEMFGMMPMDSPWVFSARKTCKHPEQRQISERRLLQYLKRLLKKLGLKGHLHTFRHTFISHAAIQGVPERVLRRWIGHVDRQILDWYFHLADEQSQAAMKRLSPPSNGRTSTAEADSSSAHFQHSNRSTKNDKRAKQKPSPA
jgi:site-specific recombinase XerD